MADHYLAAEGGTIRTPFPGLEAARNYAQAMQAVNYTTTITVENGFWVVTARKAHES